MKTVLMTLSKDCAIEGRLEAVGGLPARSSCPVVFRYWRDRSLSGGHNGRFVKCATSEPLPGTHRSRPRDRFPPQRRALPPKPDGR